MKHYCIGIALLCLWISLSLGTENQKEFNRYQIIEVGGVKDFEDEELYSKLSFDHEDEFEILHRDKTEGTAQVLVKPEIFSKFEDEIKKNKFTSKIIIEDLEELLRSQKILRVNTEPLNGESTFDRYMDCSEIKAYLSTVQTKYASKLKLTNIGKSLNGENMTMVTITEDINSSNENEKPIIFIEAGMHAREWISVASAVFLIDRLTNSSTYTKDVEWRIVPVSNPDGYRYSWTDNRLWRKNLRLHTQEKHCIGVDLNRNFGSHWGGSGSSRRRCSQIYAGESVFSEPETQAIRNAFMEVKDRVKAYISVHSYGQLILIPPSHNNMKLTRDCENYLDFVAANMSKSIAKVTKAKYIYGSPVKLLYPATGTSMDWAYSSGNSPLTFTFELRDQGKAGFLLPEQEIFHGANEFWTAMKTLHYFVDPSNSDSQNQTAICIANRAESEDDDAHLSLDISEVIQKLKTNSDVYKSLENPPKSKP